MTHKYKTALGQSIGFTLVELVISVGIMAFILPLLLSLMELSFKYTQKASDNVNSSLDVADFYHLLSNTEQCYHSFRKSDDSLATIPAIPPTPIPTGGSYITIDKIYWGSDQILTPGHKIKEYNLYRIRLIYFDLNTTVKIQDPANASNILTLKKYSGHLLLEGDAVDSNTGNHAVLQQAFVFVLVDGSNDTIVTCSKTPL